MKLKLSDTQLHILAPILSGLIVYTGLQGIFIISIAIGVEHLGAMFGIGWCAGMMCIGAVDINRWRKQAKENERRLRSVSARMEAAINHANAVVAQANEVIRRKRVEGDEWKDG